MVVAKNPLPSNYNIVKCFVCCFCQLTSASADQLIHDIYFKFSAILVGGVLLNSHSNYSVTLDLCLPSENLSAQI